MKKTIISVVAMLVLSMMVSIMPAQAQTIALPEYESHILTQAEVDEFFAIESFKQSFGDEKLCKAVSTLYDNLKAAGEADIISAINYKSVESYSEASSKEYAEYYADFELSSCEDVAVILAGNYGSYGTIPVGIVNVKAGESIRVMNTASKIIGSQGLNLTYKDIVNFVGDFDCAAIPLTPAVIKAFYPIMCDMSTEFANGYTEYSQAAADAIVDYLHDNANTLGTTDPFVIVDSNPGLRLGLSLYETERVNGSLVETGAKYTVTANIFVPYEAKVLDTAEKDAFFHDEYKYGNEIVKTVYDELKNAEQDIVYAMNFKALEPYSEASAAPYAWYIADFELKASDDVSVLLVGNYGTYSTIPLGIFNLEADKPIRIMKTASDYGKAQGNSDIAGWTFNYKEIVNFVKDFDCAAIPVSKELLKAYADATGCEYDEAAILAELVDSANPLGADSFKVADDVKLTLELKLYEKDNTTPNNGATKYDETGASWTVGSKATFTYVAPEEKTIMQRLMGITNMPLNNGNYPVHFYTGIDSLDYKEVGFNIIVKMTGEEPVEIKKATTVVYETMDITTTDGEKVRFEATRLDGAKYMFGQAMEFDPDNGWTNDNTEIVVTPYAIDLTGKVIDGKQFTISDKVVKDQNPNSALFRTGV